MLVLGVEAQKERTHVIVSLALKLALPPYASLSLPFHLVLINRLRSHKPYVTGLLRIEYTCVAFLYSDSVVIE